jgi:hypothetical protein
MNATIADVPTLLNLVGAAVAVFTAAYFAWSK